MKRKLDEKGFTLIEMMIVLLVISVLILIAIPNVAKHSGMIDQKGCEAYIKMVEGLVESYKIDNKDEPTIQRLITGEYLPPEGARCPNGVVIEIENGKVKNPYGEPSNAAPES